MIWSILFVSADFFRGLAIPAHLCLLQLGRPVDLRTPARRVGASARFWERFQNCAFSREEMVRYLNTARSIPGEERKTLLQKMGAHKAVPDTVGDSFRTLFDQFGRVTMGLCTEHDCSNAGLVHGHAYQQGRVIDETCFRSRDDALAWVQSNPKLVDGADAPVLRARIRGWDGLPPSDKAPRSSASAA